MCGRFTLTKDEDFIDYRFSKKSSAKLSPSYNIAPTNHIAVISQRNPSQIINMKWGWSQAFSTSQKIIINARSETVFDKSLYKSSIKNNRCLILADGYIEWKSTPYGKQPYLIKLMDSNIFTFAGIVRKPSSFDENFECLILTTLANSSVEHIHNRMPLILPCEMEKVWIDDSTSDFDLKNIVSTIPNQHFDSFPIDKKINHVRYNYPELLNPTESNISLFD